MLTLLEKGYSKNICDDSLTHSASSVIDGVTLSETEDQRFREIICDTEVLVFFEIL